MLVICIAMLVFGFLYSQANLQLCNTLHKNLGICDEYHKNKSTTRPRMSPICQWSVLDLQYKESEKLSQKKGS